MNVEAEIQMNGGRFDFDDGGTYVGGWQDGKAHGHGVCTGPQGKGEYTGAWHYGFEVSGVYTWPSGNSYQGQWQNGKLHGLGVEHRGKSVYRGEWTQGYKGRYGVKNSTVNQSKYQGTWSAGYHDGYGTETYVDSGTYQGQWLRGMRHGYGIRRSSTYGNAAKYRSRSHTHASMGSLRSGRGGEEEDDDETKERVTGRGGFVLKANSNAPQRRRRSLSERSLAVKRTLLTGLRIKKQHSTGDIHQRVTSMTGSLRSSGSTMSCTSEDSFHKGLPNAPEEEPIEDGVTETYMGEWKNDCRSGFGISERSDGLKYQGEWANNAKCGYGVTVLKDGTREEGKYKNNVLVLSTRRRGALFVRSSKVRERVDASSEAANRAASIAIQKADIAATRTSTARERAEQAMFVGQQARSDAVIAKMNAQRFDPNYRPTGEQMRRRLQETHGGESFGTDLSDHNPYSRHQSTTHSNLGSFEQNLSIDLGDTYTTPMGAAPSQIGNHIGQQQQQHNQQHNQQMGNHVGFHLHPTFHTQTAEAYEENAAVVNRTLTNPAPEHVLTEMDNVVELADPISYNIPSSSTTNIQLPSHLNTNLQSNAQSSSRFSISDDHFDQYVTSSSPNQPRIRRNRPSLMRQSDVNESSTNLLNRRSTLASSRDRKADPSPEPTAENMGSLPNLAALEGTGVRIRREEAARLSSQRRQEVLRERENEDLLRANPLRYIFHPALKAWLLKWKIPLLLALANISLLCLFYNLLTYEKKKTR